MPKAIQVWLSESDVRSFRVEDGYRYGVYLERDRPSPLSRHSNLCVYRVPAGMRAPLGRIPDELLALLAEEAAKPESVPEVIARFPYWSAWYPQDDVPAGTVFEEARVLPPSLTDGQGAYVQPPDAAPSPKPVKAAKE